MKENELNAKEIIGNELMVQDINEARIAKMREEYMPLVITDLKNEKQVDAVHRARIDVKKGRVLIQNVSKKTRERAVQFQKDCIAEEKRLVGLIEPIEAHLQSEEDKVQAENDRLKAEADAKEAARIQARIDRICAFGATFNGQMYTTYGLQFPVPLVKACTDEQFEQFIVQVQAAKDTEDARLKAEEEARKAEVERLAKIAADQEAERKRLEEQARKQAEEAARVKAEQEEAERKAKAEAERVAAEQAAREAKIKAEQDAIEAEKKRIADAEAKRLKDIEDEKKRVADEKLRAEELEKARLEAAEKAVKDAEAKRAKEEADRIEKERLAKIAAEKKASRAPDREKLLKLADAFTPIPMTVLKTVEGKNIFALFETELIGVVKALRDRSEAL